MRKVSISQLPHLQLLQVDECDLQHRRGQPLVPQPDLGPHRHEHGAKARQGVLVAHKVVEHEALGDRRSAQGVRDLPDGGQGSGARVEGL